MKIGPWVTQGEEHGRSIRGVNEEARVIQRATRSKKHALHAEAETSENN